ncbi:myelin-oligodendrocyte glycoprotein-like isoform X4 [Electrophorus electricus]|uniref:myelin-oligodendrocyte glycoprotein-like isoform X4 n=1 Tax=Electrophorus electricus TaxID=8005 RepID=UPI0015D08345|nr:myelin-oligodendrocyte glycoprotein-like isoform X4 [Electrophorus electricus]
MTSGKEMKLICVILVMFSGFMEPTSDFLIIGPYAPLVVNAVEDLVLPCSLQPTISAVDMTVEWFRQDLTETDQYVHLYEDHEDRNENQIRSYRGRTGLFKEELQKGNTSLKLSGVQPSDNGLYKCLIKSESWYDDITLRVTVNASIYPPPSQNVQPKGSEEKVFMHGRLLSSA